MKHICHLEDGIWYTHDIVNLCNFMTCRSLLFWDIMQCRLVVSDVSGKPIGSIFKGPLKMASIYVVLTSLKSKGLIYIAEEA
jgi:hypothetical protein